MIHNYSFAVFGHIKRHFTSSFSIRNIPTQHTQDLKSEHLIAMNRSLIELAIASHMSVFLAKQIMQKYKDRHCL